MQELINTLNKALSDLQNCEHSMIVWYSTVKKFDSIVAKRKARLKKFHIVKRLLLFKRFSKLRKYVKEAEFARLAAMQMAMRRAKQVSNLKKSIKLIEAKLNAHNSSN